MLRKMPRQEWQEAVAHLSVYRQHLLATGEVELHLLTENARILLEERRNPAMAACVLRHVLPAEDLDAASRAQFIELTKILSNYAGVDFFPAAP